MVNNKSKKGMEEIKTKRIVKKKKKKKRKEKHQTNETNCINIDKFDMKITFPLSD